MSLRYRKSIEIIPGVKLNINKKSSSITVGGKGFHVTKNINGRTTTTVNLPINGLSYTHVDNKNKTSSNSESTYFNNTLDTPTCFSSTLDTPTCDTVKSKSKTTGLICCIFGGWLGIHYFYVGRIGKGLLYLLTVGLFCFGWFYDIYRIASGKFKDSHGAYLQ